jgi:hypothetical protein
LCIQYASFKAMSSIFNPFWLHLLFSGIYWFSTRPASSSSTRSRRRPASKAPCPGLGSAGLALGGATFRGAHLGEEPGSRRRPGASLLAGAWARFGAEAGIPRRGGTSPCQGGGRARPSLHGCYGRQVLQYMAGSLGISPELWSCDGSFSLGVHRPRLRNREWTRFFNNIRSVLASDVFEIIFETMYSRLYYSIIFETMYSRLYSMMHINYLDYSRCILSTMIQFFLIDCMHAF